MSERYWFGTAFAWERLIGERLGIYPTVWAELHLGDEGGLLKNTSLLNTGLSDVEFRWAEVESVERIKALAWVFGVRFNLALEVPSGIRRRGRFTFW